MRVEINPPRRYASIVSPKRRNIIYTEDENWVCIAKSVIPVRRKATILE